jgi:hypothetical protein
MIRAATIGLHAVLIAFGMALLSRPAVLWAHGLRLFGPTRPWRLPLGWAAAVLVCAFLVLTLVASLRVAARRALQRRHHLALLLLVGLALAARAALPPDGVLPVAAAAAGATRPAADPLLPDYPRTLARYPGSSRRARSSR